MCQSPKSHIYLESTEGVCRYALLPVPHTLTAACTTSRTRATRRDFFTVGRSRTTRPLRSGSQGSFPGIVARNRRPGCLKGLASGHPQSPCLRQTGLPHPVCEPRTFLAPELRPLELTRFTVAVNRTALILARDLHGVIILGANWMLKYKLS